VLAYIF